MVKQATIKSICSHALKYFFMAMITGCMLQLAGCGKPDTVDSELQVVQFLTGSGNRVWRIKEVYENGVKTTLTASQLQYTKTYTLKGLADDYTGNFNDSDANAGNWTLNSRTQLTETITNLSSGNVTIVLTINAISANDMDVSYQKNGVTIRTVYFAY